MADTASYIAQMLAGTGLQNKEISDLIAELGGVNNPNSFAYNPAELMDVNIPTLMSIAEYLQKTGAEGYQYNYDDILNAMNQATALQRDLTNDAVVNAQNQYYRGLANNQLTAADTIQNQAAQAIQAGITKGMQNANLLSTILGTQQQGVEGAQALADQQYQAGLEYAKNMGNNVNLARTEANTALETLLGNIRQLYNDDIQRETAELEYNASTNETNANAAAQKYAADTNYSSGVLTNATNLKNQLAAALAQIAAQAANSAAQDNYSNAYAQRQAASAAASASSSSGGGGGSSSGGSSGGGSSSPTAASPMQTASQAAANAAVLASTTASQKAKTYASEANAAAMRAAESIGPATQQQIAMQQAAAKAAAQAATKNTGSSGGGNSNARNKAVVSAK